MTDLTDEDLNALVAELNEPLEYYQNGYRMDVDEGEATDRMKRAAAVITALRRREAEAVAGAVESDALCQSAAAVIAALRKREAEAVAGAIESAATISQNRWAWCKKRAESLYEMDYAEAKADARSVSARGDEADSIAAAIRALHTDATRAALDRVRAEGMREGKP